MRRLKNKRGRPSNYRKSLQSNTYWKFVRIKVLVRDFHSCICCNLRTKLEVHHIAYRVDGISIRGRELEYLQWLVTVCEDCHDEIHSNLNHPLNPKNKNKINEYTYRNNRENR